MALPMLKPCVCNSAMCVIDVGESKTCDYTENMREGKYDALWMGEIIFQISMMNEIQILK